MATNYGVNADLILVDNPSQKPGVGEQGGVMKVIYDTFELTADLAAADTIEMGGLIPAGARIMDVHLFHDALGAGTLDVGWKASADGVEAAVVDGFVDGAAVTSQGHASLQEDHFAEAGMFKKFAAPVQPVVTVATDTSATSGTISLAIFYVLD
jgi:hypothetical protein